MSIPIYYEIPLFVFILLGLYTIYSLIVARKCLEGGNLSKPYLWFIIATVFFLLWSFDHIYNDIVPAEESAVFYHYFISHGLLLISMICIAIAAGKTKRIYESFIKKNSEGFKKTEKPEKSK